MDVLVILEASCVFRVWRVVKDRGLGCPKISANQQQHYTAEYIMRPPVTSTRPQYTPQTVCMCVCACICMYLCVLVCVCECVSSRSGGKGGVNLLDMF